MNAHDLGDIAVQSRSAGKWVSAAAAFPYLLPAAIIGAELATVKLSAEWGLFAYFVILFGSVFSGAALAAHPLRGLCIATGLIPILRIAQIGMPIPELSDIYVILIATIPVFIGILTVSRSLHFSQAAIGVRGGDLIEQLAVGYTGIGFGMIGYEIIEPQGLVANLTPARALVPAIILLITHGLVRELAFRGVMQRAAGAVGRWGWVYIAMLYAAFQAGELSVPYCFFVLAVAGFWGWVVRASGCIWGVALSHGIMSLLMFLILPEVMD